MWCDDLLLLYFCWFGVDVSHKPGDWFASGEAEEQSGHGAPHQRPTGAPHSPAVWHRPRLEWCCWARWTGSRGVGFGPGWGEAGTQTLWCCVPLLLQASLFHKERVIVLVRVQNLFQVNLVPWVFGIIGCKHTGHTELMADGVQRQFDSSCRCLFWIFWRKYKNLVQTNCRTAGETTSKWV